MRKERPALRNAAALHCEQGIYSEQPCEIIISYNDNFTYAQYMERLDSTHTNYRKEICQCIAKRVA